VHAVRAAHIKAYLAWRRVRRRKPVTATDGKSTDRKSAVSNRTLAKDLSVLSRLFAYADELEWRDGNPAARVTAPKHDGRQPVILSDAEYDKLLEACDGRPMLKLYLLTVGELGARNESEVLWLQWPDVELDSGFVRIVTGRGGHRTKTGRSRWVPMSPRLQSAMRAHFARYRFAAYDGNVPKFVPKTVTCGVTSIAVSYCSTKFCPRSSGG
jgi:integrase